MGLIGGVFNGCSSHKQRVVVEKAALPSWYLHPPLSSDRVLYGVGDGKTREAAISNALSMILSTLSVSISSKYSAKSIVREGSINSSDATYVNETESEVKKIRISNYEVLQAKSLGFRHYGVLVKVDKYKFFLSLKKEIEQQFAIIYSKEQTLQNKNALRQIAFYKKSLRELDGLPNRLVVMSVLNEKFDSAHYLLEYDTLQQHYLTLLHKITFWVRANYAPLATPIAKGLSLQKFIVKRARGAMHFRVDISANIQRANSYGFYLARAVINITTRDYRGSVIATNAFSVTGQSSQSFGIAKQDIVKKLNALVEKEGIGKVLQLDI